LLTNYQKSVAPQKKNTLESKKTLGPSRKQKKNPILIKILGYRKKKQEGKANFLASEKENS